MGQDTEDNRAPHRPAGGVDGVPGSLDVRQDPARVREKCLPCRREPYAPAPAHEQLRAQLAFKLFNPGRHGGLDYVHSAGAAGEAQGIGDRNEVFDLKDLHATSIANDDEQYRQ
jgi:hypothetical protein